MRVMTSDGRDGMKAAFCLAALSGALLGAAPAQAASLSASLASESLGVSSGLVSDSVSGVSKGSSKAVGLAQGPWEVIHVADAPKAGQRQTLTLRRAAAADAAPIVQLMLPQGVVRSQALTTGDVIHVGPREWGYALARGDAATPFFVLLHDDWARGLQARALEP